jgi:hypothetical protein
MFSIISAIYQHDADSKIYERHCDLFHRPITTLLANRSIVKTEHLEVILYYAVIDSDRNPLVQFYSNDGNSRLAAALTNMYAQDLKVSTPCNKVPRSNPRNTVNHFDCTIIILIFLALEWDDVLVSYRRDNKETGGSTISYSRRILHLWCELYE